MAVILKYEIEGGDYYELYSPETHISNGWFEPHEKKTWHEDDKVVEIEYEPTDEEYAECLVWYAKSELPFEEVRKWDKEHNELALKLAAAMLKANPELKEAMDKDEEWAWNLSLEHKLEEFE